MVATIMLTQACRSPHGHLRARRSRMRTQGGATADRDRPPVIYRDSTALVESCARPPAAFSKTVLAARSPLAGDVSGIRAAARDHSDRYRFGRRSRRCDSRRARTRAGTERGIRVLSAPWLAD